MDAQVVAVRRLVSQRLVLPALGNRVAAAARFLDLADRRAPVVRRSGRRTSGRTRGPSPPGSSSGRRCRPRRRALLLELADVPVLAVRQVPEVDRVGRVEVRARHRVGVEEPVAVDDRAARLDRRRPGGPSGSPGGGSSGGSARRGSSRSAGGRRPRSRAAADGRGCGRRSTSSRRSRPAPCSRPPTARPCR